MVKRQFQKFAFTDLQKIKLQVLHWSARFNTCSYLDNNQYPSDDAGYECLVGAGETTRLKTSAGTAFAELRQFSIEHNDWLFGHFSYDLKSETENSPCLLPDHIGFPGCFFFVPKVVLKIGMNELEVGSLADDQAEIFNQIIQTDAVANSGSGLSSVSIENRISKEAYIEIVSRLQQHILRGDCYEINFCQEFFAEGVDLRPLDVYQLLSSVSPSPFSAFYKMDEKYLLCSSPERYLKRTGKIIFSQPIKGTSARDLFDISHDEYLKQQLINSAKDRAENVMVVDLVRNDLSRVCEPDSVRVAELFGIYSFAQVHQMISTITGRVRADLHWTQMVSKTFPMGSMTGAPKKRVLQLIEQYEKSNRGLFSGAVGYVSPDNDFDFNVVIRSLLYNRERKYLAYFAGSAITADSNPEEEYEECLLKVAVIKTILKNPFPDEGMG